jgi:uncharacterized protein
LCEPVTAEFLSCEDEEEEGRRKSEYARDGGLRGNWLDLLPMVRDAIHLAVPIAPRCRPDCRGLCPDCGADLNREPCRCAAEEAAKAPSASRPS